jgi:hypothetical protein
MLLRNTTHQLCLCLSLILFSSIAWISCETSGDTDGTPTDTFQLFKEISSRKSGVNFSNDITENEEKHYFNFQYMYNGGGVAAGDINNDGLPDLYFTSNEGANKLYLNKGDLKFEDITAKAGVDGGEGWDMGVSMIDINEDGFLDIYVCKSGWQKINPVLRKNLLFINQGDNTFKEQAAQYGLANGGFSVQAVYLDYDNDGDLDMYLTNHPTDFDVKKENQLRNNPSPQISDRLFQNNGDLTFTDVSDKAGIKNYGHGLGPVTGDVNNDGFTDIYVANDYKENDYLYINNGDGTFTDKIKEMTAHVSFYAMGADISDINNDGLQDILTTEMLPEDYKRSKTNMAAMNIPFFRKLLAHGYHHQYMHNSLQINRGNDFFSEVSQMAGISKTDWSWSCLIADLDNDSQKDIFISNGFKRDVFNKDYTKEIDKLAQKQKGQVSPTQIYEAMPSTKLSNYVYQNNGDLQFTNRVKDWGISRKMISNGTTLADLDNDGDYELICNNLDETAAIYKNMATEKSGNNYLNINLEGNKGNRLGVGSIISLEINDLQLSEEMKGVRGYQSCLEYQAHFGLGKNEQVDKIQVKWKDGTITTQNNVAANQTITIKQADSQLMEFPPAAAKLFEDQTANIFDEPFKHQENSFDDYTKQVLLPHEMSKLGPFTAVADINGDQLEDLFIGGAMNQPGAIYIQNKEGKLIKTNQPSLEDGSSFEDMGAIFFDADKDGDMDLYVASGGTEFGPSSTIYQDRLYTNENGIFKRNHEALPTMTTSSSSVTLADVDKDGDMDIFVGGRVIPDQYPYSPNSYILANNNGTFVDITAKVAPQLSQCGMVTSAIWTDYNQDGAIDLIVVGEWMPIRIFENQNGIFTEKTKELNLERYTGWWNKIVASDVNNDGKMDYILGNLGLNYKFKASQKKPFHIFTDDFDSNGTIDIVLAKDNKNKLVPIRGKQCSSQQMPFVNEKFPTYDGFADASVQDIIGESINKALHLEATTFESGILMNNGDTFEFIPFPNMAQISTINAIQIDDWNDDNIKDIIISGNMYGSEAETTRADSSIGLLLLGDKNGTFSVSNNEENGLFIKGDTKDSNTIILKNKKHLIFSKNNDALQIISIH